MQKHRQKKIRWRKKCIVKRSSQLHLSFISLSLSWRTFPCWTIFRVSDISRIIKKKSSHSTFIPPYYISWNFALPSCKHLITFRVVVGSPFSSSSMSALTYHFLLDDPPLTQHRTIMNMDCFQTDETITSASSDLTSPSFPSIPYPAFIFFVCVEGWGKIVTRYFTLNFYYVFPRL